MAFGIKYFSSRRQLFLFLQLQLSSISYRIVTVYNWFYVLHATLTYFEFMSVEYAIINVDFPIFVETFLLNGGLNLMIFLLCYYAFDG